MSDRSTVTVGAAVGGVDAGSWPHLSRIGSTDLPYRMPAVLRDWTLPGWEVDLKAAVRSSQVRILTVPNPHSIRICTDYR